ncbi:3-mercaptopyruvate sulfurtransferase [Kordia antarctica]|uniref:3-mercaptopyruvate sulfurtransferase n=1 Tax=Kordia antarctica TaxID=1218801 RepID=A0A7L4ZDZ5_9FLAO|nr:sulfurtransferase [Kordia antarctica]QHI34963.1 3-mercaptopyruvate sulfurtransferase [Kordia antarctica]
MKLQISNPIISRDWLQEQLNATNLVILNGTISRVIDAEKEAETQQIPNARFFDIKKVFSSTDAPFPNTMLNVETFTEEAQKLGINKDSAIVVYDELGMYSAPRVWFIFKAMGFNTIAVLNGGFPSWKDSNYPVETKKPFQGKRGNFQGKDRLSLFRNYTEMLQEVKNTSSLILDARSEARFTGKVPEPRKGLRSGQIPNSKNLPYSKLLENHQFKSKEEISAIFESFQPKETHFIFSCGSGITACILALAAEYAGFEDYAVYDGSWTEWGSTC